MEFVQMRTHYDILGVDRDASEEEIIQAYKALSRANKKPRNTPNVYKTQMGLLLDDSYKVLSSPTLKALYDSDLDRINSRGQHEGPEVFRRLAALENKQSRLTSKVHCIDAFITVADYHYKSRKNSLRQRLTHMFGRQVVKNDLNDINLIHSDLRVDIARFSSELRTKATFNVPIDEQAVLQTLSYLDEALERQAQRVNKNLQFIRAPG
ncbi:MAG: DnaJ domain-containing protein [Rhodospirillales bacterium]|nr:DnaJ domain-containing protein [Rhodospirillales bacterium]MCB9995747.1 DnaJ domain-containing protein [Rhodospirillales bacterium]